MRGKEETIKIKGTFVTFTYHTDWYMGKEQGFWRADTDRGTITWNRSKTELKKEVIKNKRVIFHGLNVFAK